MAASYWRCRRVSKGVVCGTLNLAKKRLCTACGKPKPRRKPPAHRAVLSMPYEWWVAQFGERCGICGIGPSPTRRLDRDHCHRTGAARGMLCHYCNRTLGSRITLEWMRAAVAYLERAEENGRAAA